MTGGSSVLSRAQRAGQFLFVQLLAGIAVGEPMAFAASGGGQTSMANAGRSANGGPATAAVDAPTMVAAASPAQPTNATQKLRLSTANALPEGAYQDVLQRLNDLEARVEQQAKLLEMYSQYVTGRVPPNTAYPTLPGFMYVQGLQPEPPVPVPPRPRAPSAAPAPRAVPQPSPQGQTQGAPEQPVAAEERPESEKPFEQLLIEQGGVLLPPGFVQVQPGVEYLHSSNNNIVLNGVTFLDAITVGQIRVDNIDRDVVTSSITLRGGVIKDLQAEVVVPYVYSSSDTTFGVGQTGGSTEESSKDRFGIGDVEAEAAYQVLYGRKYIPDTVVRVRGRFPTGESAFDIGTTQTEGGRFVAERPPTGSGFYGLAPGLTLLWRADPVVFTAGGNYTFNFEKEYNGTNWNPGDSYQFFGGINIALSEIVSLNMSFSDQITSKLEADGQGIDGTQTNDGRIVFGSSISIWDNAVLLISAQAGLTNDAPDFVFSVSVPMTFNLF